MRAEYDRQLRELEEELFDMGSMCQQAVAFSGAVLIGDDETLREQVCSPGIYPKNRFWKRSIYPISAVLS